MNKNYLIIGLIILALVVIGVIAARQPKTPVEEQPQTETETETTPTASIKTSDQVVDGDSVVIDSVYAPTAGWVVVYGTTSEGELDPKNVIGTAEVPAGASSNVKVDLTKSVKEGDVIMAMLHEDTGVVGEYEFSEEKNDVDTPVLVDDEVVVSMFTVSTEKASTTSAGDDEGSADTDTTAGADVDTSAEVETAPTE